MKNTMRHFRGRIAFGQVEQATLDVPVSPVEQPLQTFPVRHDLLQFRLQGHAPVFLIQSMDTSPLIVAETDEVEVAGRLVDEGQEPFVLVYAIRNLTDGVIYLVVPEGHRKWRFAHILAAVLALPGIGIALHTWLTDPQVHRRELLLYALIGPGLIYGSYCVVGLLGLTNPADRVNQPGDTMDLDAACKLLGLDRRQRKHAVRL